MPWTGVTGPDRRAPGCPKDSAAGSRYHRKMLGLVMLVVVAVIWSRRRLMVRRARISALEEARVEAERLAREQAVIAEMEADFLRG